MKQTSDTKTATVRVVWEKYTETEYKADRGSDTGNEEEGI